jgi:type IV secretory pathway ATPase VirB11/archaellum biosynthesis ATPase
MENTLAYDDLRVLKKVLNMTVRNLKKDTVKSENDVYNRNIRKKIRFVKWILDLIISGDFTYQEIMDMIDLKTESGKILIMHWVKAVRNQLMTQLIFWHGSGI